MLFSEHDQEGQICHFGREASTRKGEIPTPTINEFWLDARPCWPTQVTSPMAPVLTVDMSAGGPAYANRDARFRCCSRHTEALPNNSAPCGRNRRPLSVFPFAIILYIYIIYSNDLFLEGIGTNFFNNILWQVNHHLNYPAIRANVRPVLHMSSSTNSNDVTLTLAGHHDCQPKLWLQRIRPQAPEMVNNLIPIH